jgi:hypothetical protein
MVCSVWCAVYVSGAGPAAVLIGVRSVCGALSKAPLHDGVELGSGVNLCVWGKVCEVCVSSVKCVQSEVRFSGVCVL